MFRVGQDCTPRRSLVSSIRVGNGARMGESAGHDQEHQAKSNWSVIPAQRAPRLIRRPFGSIVIDVPATNLLPRWIAPQLTLLITVAPSGPGWLHEIKLDGFRTSARLENGKARLLTRTGRQISQHV